MNAFEIYIVMMASSLKISLIMIGVLGILITSIITGVILDTNNTKDVEGRAKKLWKVYFLSFLFLFIFGLISPTTKVLVAMYTVPSIVNNEKVQMLPEKILDLIDKKVGEALGK